MERVLADQSRLRQGRRPALTTAIEPASIFAVRSLLQPVAAVGCLLVCLLFWGEPLYGPYFLLAVLTFLAAADLFEVAEFRRDDGRYASIRSLLDILMRWMLVMAFVWAVFRLS